MSACFGTHVNAIAPRANTRMIAAYAEALGMSLSGDDDTGAMRPELVAPAAAFLVHESCSLNWEVFHVGSGRVGRMAVVLSDGIASDQLTPEDVATRLDRIMDLEGARAIGLDGVEL